MRGCDSFLDVKKATPPPLSVNVVLVGWTKRDGGGLWNFMKELYNVIECLCVRVAVLRCILALLMHLPFGSLRCSVSFNADNSGNTPRKKERKKEKK